MRSSAALMSNSSAFAALRAEKDAVRRALRTTLRSLPAEQLAQESAHGVLAAHMLVCPLTGCHLLGVTGAAITERLLASEVFKRSSRVGIYVSCDRLCEVNTHAVLHALFRTGACHACTVAPAPSRFLHPDTILRLCFHAYGRPRRTTALLHAARHGGAGADELPACGCAWLDC
jgi:hypothetical protein